MLILCYSDLEAALVNNSQERRIFGEADDFVRNSSWTDRVKSVASRVLHGEFYKWFYVVISVLSVLALFTVILHFVAVTVLTKDF